MTTNTRDDVLAEFTMHGKGHANGTMVTAWKVENTLAMADEIVRLRQQLADTQRVVEVLREPVEMGREDEYGSLHITLVDEELAVVRAALAAVPETNL